MIKINYKELPKYLNDDHLYQLRNAYTDADIVYPVETYRSPSTDEYIIYVRHKLDSDMLNFDVHCFTEVFAKECYDYIKSVLVCQNTPNAVVTLSTYCDFFIKYLIKNAVTLLDMDILPSFIADDFDQGVLTNVSDITVRKGCSDDLSLIHEFKKSDPSPRNDIEYYIPSIHDEDIRSALFIALKNGCIVGYLISAPYNNKEYVEVQDIYISPEHRGKNYGSILSRAYKEYILKRGYKPLYSDADNHASVKVALKSGFKFDHIRIVSMVKFKLLDY